MIDKKFALAGLAIFTVSNPKGQHFTYKITSRQDNGPFFIHLLTGPNNLSDYTYLGMVNLHTGQIYLTKASRYTADSLPYKVANWALELIWDNKTPPEGYKISNVGRCGRCARTLTTPQSIEAGLGPECLLLMG